MRTYYDELTAVRSQALDYVRIIAVDRDINKKIYGTRGCTLKKKTDHLIPFLSSTYLKRV